MGANATYASKVKQICGPCRAGYLWCILAVDTLTLPVMDTDPTAQLRAELLATLATVPASRLPYIKHVLDTPAQDVPLLTAREEAALAAGMADVAAGRVMSLEDFLTKRADIRSQREVHAKAS